MLFRSIIASVINLPSTLTCYLDLSKFILEFELSYFRVLTIFPQLVDFVSAERCHCFDCEGYKVFIVTIFKP